jgi:hypothetical protein
LLLQRRQRSECAFRYALCAQEQFLHARIKVGGKVGVLGESIAITREGNVISVTAKVEFAKRYLKVRPSRFTAVLSAARALSTNPLCST